MSFARKIGMYFLGLHRVSAKAWWEGFLCSLIVLAAWSELVGRGHLDYRAGLATMLLGLLASAWLFLDEEGHLDAADGGASK
jgi:hypothetical protein